MNGKVYRTSAGTAGTTSCSCRSIGRERSLVNCGGESARFSGICACRRGHALADHVHLCLSIPPKYSVANTIGFLKGKSAIRIHRDFLGREQNFTGFHFWARGYCVSTVGLDEQKIREYIRNQEEEEKRQEQLPLGGLQPPSRPKR